MAIGQELALAIVRQNLLQDRPWVFDAQGQAVVQEALCELIATTDAARSPSTPPDVWREKVARIIDPAGWRMFDDRMAAVENQSPERQDKQLDQCKFYIRQSMAKAAQIIASISVQDRRGSVGEEDLGSVAGCADAQSTLPRRSQGAATPSEGDFESDAWRVAAEAYQVIGALAFLTGTSDAPEVVRALDYFSGIAPCELDGSILPWLGARDIKGVATKPEADGEASKREARGRPNPDLPPSQGEPES
jgi:hypothetical protein